ncbi:hypothetical protein JTF06_11590 [Desemzia sp. RIT804]|uniref:hypothetical protein n=1 Tax=Desemzia sp. RIT 804 TaxID=2810209 RepID=UPI001951134D|nr:hypothetical protein [Desemzia sp. RIT 804]MBM6615526.1 hypothetical protein [Desemzia sp. RIT 804]
MDLTKNKVNVQYAYVLIKSDTEIELEIDQEDFILNADGEMDIPLELILRKNDLTLNDLYIMNIQKLLFIRKNNGQSCTLRQICLNVNL